jgi:predicted acyl esterase
MTAAMLRSEVHEGIRIDWDVPIRMSDGVTLRCDVFRPDDDRRYPVLMGVTPYGKWLSFQDEVWGGQWQMLTRHEPEILKLSTNRLQNYEFPDPERFVRDGYVLVRVDARGTGRSPGLLDLLSAREAQDFYESIEWAAAQPWANGRVGLSGVSYLAMNQWQVAALRPPHLSAICVWEGCSDFHREFTRHGGILSQFSDLWFEKYILPARHGLGERGWKSNINGEWVSGPETASDEELARTLRDWRQDVRTHRLANARFWRERLPDFGKIETPLLSAANWGGQGLHLRGNVEGFLQAKSPRKWLNFHCFEHWTEYYTQSGVALQKKFLGHFLKDEDNGWAAEPRVQMLVRRPGTPFHPRPETEWPLSGTQWTRFHLHADGSLLQEQPPVQAALMEYRALGSGLTFITPPLPHDLHVIGPASARLRISSSTADADLFLVLRLFTPDLSEVTYSGSNDPHTPMSHGWLRASLRKLDPQRSLPYRPYHTMDEVQPLRPGAEYELEIEIWPTCFVAPAGYRIALSIRGRDYEYPGDLSGMRAAIGQPFTGVGPFRHTSPEDRPAGLFDNRVTLHIDPREPPFLLLPVAPPAP